MTLSSVPGMKAYTNYSANNSLKVTALEKKADDLQNKIDKINEDTTLSTTKLNERQYLDQQRATIQMHISRLQLSENVSDSKLEEITTNEIKSLDLLA